MPAGGAGAADEADAFGDESGGSADETDASGGDGTAPEDP